MKVMMIVRGTIGPTCSTSLLLESNLRMRADSHTVFIAVRTHDHDNDSYQHCIQQCGWSALAYFVRIYVSVYAYAETVCVSGSTGVFAKAQI